MTTKSYATALPAEFGGSVIEPGDAGYDEARAVWNGEIDRRPAVIVQCATPADVAAAIRLARDAGLEVSVRGGAHNFAGFAVAEQGLVIDLRHLNAVQVDPARQVATCGGGATWKDVDEATQQHGLGVTGGLISHTGIGGLTLGGGLGWLTRKRGLTCDSLTAAQLVTAQGEILRASREENPELFWAIRGGGGNFGVATALEYRLCEVGPLIQFGAFFWVAENGTTALTFCRELFENAPNDLGMTLVGRTAPDAPFVPEQYHNVPGYLLTVVGFAAEGDHAKIADRIRQECPPAFEVVTPMSYVDLQKMSDATNAWGSLAYEKALYLDELSDATIEWWNDHLPQDSSGRFRRIVAYVLGGAYAEVEDGATAFGGQRQAAFSFTLNSIGATKDLFETDRSWVRESWDAMRPFSSSSAGYVNMMAEYETARVQATYGAAKYARLAAAKRLYDPDNVFHLNQNIKPA